jgi:enterochelin esterase-like enzyme
VAGSESVGSPRIAALERALDGCDSAALDAFWREIEREGTPLIEAIPGGDAAQRLVTFLWREEVRDSNPLTNVVVVGSVVGWDFAHNQMRRLRDTDLWYGTYQLAADTRTTYLLARNDSLISILEEPDPDARWASFIYDPLARRQQIFPANEEDPNDYELTFSVLELPDAPSQPWVAPREDVDTGMVTKHRIASERLGNERRVWVYTPPGYDSFAEDPYNLLVVFDGFAYLHVVPTPTILDNLLADGLIAPMVAVLVDSPNRNVDLPCSAPFADFLVEELLPWLRERYTVTSDPARVVVAGSSYGGLAAAYAGFRHPEVFGNVLSQSGAFWWRPEETQEHGWLIRQFVAAEPLPLHFYMDAGAFERGIRDPSILLYNRHLRDVPRAKGYPVAYAELSGGHDYLYWQGTLADGLIALVGR